MWDLQACSIDAVPRHHSRVIDLAATSDGKMAVSLGALSDDEAWLDVVECSKLYSSHCSSTHSSAGSDHAVQ